MNVQMPDQIRNLDLEQFESERFALTVAEPPVETDLVPSSKRLS